MRLDIACLVVGSAVLAGCSSVPSGFVSKNWSENIRELNIYPLFPPNADVHVGDAFAISPLLEEHDGFAPLGTFLLKVDSKSIIEEHYRDRGHFGSAGSVTNALPSDSNYLRQVGFPFFVHATVRGGELGAFMPFDALKKELSLGANSVTSATVSISAAEVQRVPMLNLMPKLWAHMGCMTPKGQMDGKAELLNGTLAWSVPQGAKPGEQYYEIAFINEVYYARTFDVTLHLADSSGLRAFNERKIRIEAETPAVEAPKVVAAQDGASKEGGAATTTAVPTAVEAAATTEIKDAKQRAALNTPSLPGVSIVASSTAVGDIGLRQTFDQRLAIGYRGTHFLIPTNGNEWVGQKIEEGPNAPRTLNLSGRFLLGECPPHSESLPPPTNTSNPVVPPKSAPKVTDGPKNNSQFKLTDPRLLCKAGPKADGCPTPVKRHEDLTP